MLINLLAGLLGIALYTVIKAKSFISGKKVKEFDWNKLKEDNALGWAYSALMLAMIWTILIVVPESSDLISQLLGGIEIKSTPLGFLLIGNALGFLGKEATDE